MPDIRELKEGLDARARRLNAVMNRLTERRRLCIEQRELRVREAVNRALEVKTAQCDSLCAQLSDAARKLSDRHERLLLGYRSRLDALNPERVLTRGYALVEKNGVPVGSSAALHRDDNVVLRFSDGTQTAVITGD